MNRLQVETSLSIHGSTARCSPLLQNDLKLESYFPVQFAHIGVLKYTLSLNLGHDIDGYSDLSHNVLLVLFGHFD